MIEAVKPYAELIKTNAASFGLSPAVIAAICAKESSFDPKAMRYEPNYKWLWRVSEFAGSLKITFRTEEQLQCFSYGLMQVMGANARSYGFSEYLPALLDIEKNLYFGCRHLRNLYDRFAKATPTDGWSDAIISAYNAGSPRRAGPKRWINEIYVRGVETFYNDFRSAGWV